MDYRRRYSNFDLSISYKFINCIIYILHYCFVISLQVVEAMKHFTPKGKREKDLISRITSANQNKPIEEILRELYVDKGLGLKSIATTLSISHPTVIKWLRLAGIYSHNLDLEVISNE